MAVYFGTCGRGSTRVQGLSFDRVIFFFFFNSVLYPQANYGGVAGDRREQVEPPSVLVE